jgi:hypothetical protein
MRAGWRRGDGDGEGGRWRGREIEVIRTQIGTSEREVGRGCLTSTQTKEKGQICLTSTRPDAGIFIVAEVDTTQISYERK